MQWVHSGERSRVIRTLAGITLVATVAMTAVPSRAAGGEIAYVGPDRHTIHLVQADGRGDRQLLSVANGFAGPLAWAPDGTILAYTQTNPPSIRMESQRIVLFDTRTGRATEVRSSIGTYGVVAFFPDAKHLAAASGAGPTANCDGGVVSIDLGTGTATPLISVGACLGSLQVT
jgi:hypothetical protein